MATLSQRVNTFFDGRVKNGARGLELIHDAVVHMGKEHDWDAIAQFISKADKLSDKTPTTVARLAVWCYFGDVVKIRKVDDHPTGYRFTFGSTGKWPSEDGKPLAVQPTNHFSVIAKAVEDGVSIDNAKFIKALRDERNDTRIAPPTSDTRVKMEKAGIRLAKTLFEENIPISVVVQAMEKQLAALKAQAAKEQANVVRAPAEETSNVTSHDDLMEAITNAA